MELDGRRRVIIECPAPEVDDGRFPAKRVAGDVVVAEADIFTDGHDVISAVVLHRRAGEVVQTEVLHREFGPPAVIDERQHAQLRRLTFTGATNGTGTNVVNYSVATNPNPADRLGAVVVLAAQSQPRPACTVTELLAVPGPWVRWVGESV